MINEVVGYIYILTSLGIPNYVKIGYADDVLERLRVLNSSEVLPFSLRVYATYGVPVRLADKKLHAIIDQLNPQMRAVEIKDGKIRTREFYAMDPEEAYNILYAMAEIHGCVDRIKKWEVSEEDKKNQENNDQAVAAKTRRENFKFSKADIPIGSTIEFIGDPSKTAEVISDTRVRYDGEAYSLSNLACVLTEKPGPLQGTIYFTYEGEILDERRRRIEEEMEEGD